MTPDDLGPDEHELLARLANRYYTDGQTQEALAREFGLSRAKVQRLLDRARATGVVDIRIAAPSWLRLDLERRLRERFGLAEAIVAPARDDPDAQREEVARVAARYLERHLVDGAVVAVSHGRDTGEVPRFFRPAHRVDATFVSAMGGSPHTDAPTNPNDIARRWLTDAAARAVALYAPAYVESDATRDGLLRQEAVAETLSHGGSTADRSRSSGSAAPTTVHDGPHAAASRTRRCAGSDAGAVGDVLGNYVDVDGGRLDRAETARLIGLSVDDLHRVETVVAVVSEREKPLAIRGVLRTGVVDVLIVDEPNGGSSPRPRPTWPRP